MIEEEKTVVEDEEIRWTNIWFWLTQFYFIIYLGALFGITILPSSFIHIFFWFSILLMLLIKMRFFFVQLIFSAMTLFFGIVVVFTTFNTFVGYDSFSHFFSQSILVSIWLTVALVLAYLVILDLLIIMHRICRMIIGKSNKLSPAKLFVFYMQVTIEDIIWNLVNLFQVHTPYPIELYRLLGLRTGNNANVFALISIPSAITLGDNVTIGREAKMTAQAKSYKGTHFIERVKIGNDVLIGGASVILPGVTIEDNVVIAAGSVVPRGVYKGDTLYGGVPAKPIKQLEPKDHEKHA